MPERHRDLMQQALDHAKLWIELAKALDKHYLPARYPNGFAAGTPREHYTRREAEQAIADAEVVVEFCQRSLPR